MEPTRIDLFWANFWKTVLNFPYANLFFKNNLRFFLFSRFFFFLVLDGNFGNKLMAFYYDFVVVIVIIIF